MMTGAKDFGRVALVIGGQSNEAEISRRGGADVYQAMQDAGVNVVKIDGVAELRSRLCANEVDVVFNLLHGKGGEDGVIHGLLAAHNVPCTGTGISGALTSMEKLVAKAIWQTAGLPTPAWIEITPNINSKEIQEKLGPNVVVKPTNEGSSVAVEICHDLASLEAALDSVGARCDVVMVERQIVGTEMTAGFIGELDLPLIRIEPNSGFYDYQAKYESADTRYICPAGLAEAEEKMLQALARKAYELCGIRGWGRVDFMLDEESKPWLLEANTTPGMTASSLIPKAARQCGIDFGPLVLRILETAEVPA